MAAIRRILTVHADTSVAVRLALLDAVEGALHGHGASRVWIDTDHLPDFLVLAEFEDG
jgi:hypothetical protein